MNSLKTLLYWIIAGLAFGLVWQFIYSDNNLGVYVVTGFVGFVIGISHAFLIYAGTQSNKSIIEEAKLYFGAKENLNGELELQLLNKRIIMAYKMEHSMRGASEFVIANIDVSGLDKNMLQRCGKKFDIVNEDSRSFVQVYCSWGYHGERFRARLLEKLEELNNCINNLEATV